MFNLMHHEANYIKGNTVPELWFSSPSIFPCSHPTAESLTSPKQSYLSLLFLLRNPIQIIRWYFPSSPPPQKKKKPYYFRLSSGWRWYKSDRLNWLLSTKQAPWRTQQCKQAFGGWRSPMMLWMKMWFRSWNWPNPVPVCVHARPIHLVLLLS